MPPPLPPHANLHSFLPHTRTYSYELGAASYVNTNVDTAQNIDHIDYLFTGDFLGKKSDIASGELRQYDFRTYNNIVGDYYVAPKFLEAVRVRVCACGSACFLLTLRAGGVRVRAVGRASVPERSCCAVPRSSRRCGQATSSISVP